MESNKIIKAAEWFERLALAVFAVLVVEKIFTGASFVDKTVIYGVIIALVFYAFAFTLLIKS